MLHYIVRRLFIAMPVLLGITILNFCIVNLAPGNPVDMFLDPNTPQQLVDAKKEMLGLNDPLIIQYFKWLWQLIQGGFGYSYSSFAPVTHLIGERIGPTLMLTSISLTLGLLIAIPIGILSAVKQNTRFDYIMTGLSFIWTSIPQFFLGLGLIYVFALHFKILPTGGMLTIGGDASLADRLKHLILPVSVLTIAIIGKKIRYVRASMLDVLKQDYLRTARAKGLHAFIVTNKHALRNALVPIITVFGMEIPLLLGGSIIIEQIFQWPGIGQLTMQSILSRDYPTLMGLNFIAAIIVLATNLFMDILYFVADPRVKYN